MPVVIRIVGLVNGTPTRFDGEYLKRYEIPLTIPPPDAILETTPLITAAKQYPSIVEAHQEWTLIDTRAPIRADGQPNRPLTAFTIELLPAPA